MAVQRERGLSVLWAYDGLDTLPPAAFAIRWLGASVGSVRVLTVAPASSCASVEAAHAAARRGQRLLQEMGGSAEARAVRGHAGAEIARFASDGDVDLLVLDAGPPAAAAGEGIMERVLLGTTCPVLLARRFGVAIDAPVVLPFETPRRLRAALSLLASLRLPPDVHLQLLAFLEPIRQPAGMLLTLNEHVRWEREVVRSTRRKLVAAYLDRTADALSSAHGRDVATLVEDGNAVESLKSFLDDNPAPLVILGADATARTGAAAETIEAALRLPCPVLVAR